jgi:hypothetical protein
MLADDSNLSWLVDDGSHFNHVARLKKHKLDGWLRRKKGREIW